MSIPFRGIGKTIGKKKLSGKKFDTYNIFDYLCSHQ